ncbi:hypothetical protein BKA67DRAFT_654824 [Truncatella angustata]|uniref:Uncharacterized protein n=1 Tax=Truncatella angustata TaxID=152316 RepID=A0A9P8UQJ3_9PEZI|nr:uncharacterized protein BKA67DRAFT_654824 [Truncatella angustata]KAH6656486.1 hypothetical protein BKA67DRAFT_654824 [Truncatella angustata]
MAPISPAPVKKQPDIADVDNRSRLRLYIISYPTHTIAIDQLACVMMILSIFVLLAGLCLAATSKLSDINHVLRTFSYPGISFRRAPAISSKPVQGQKQQAGPLVISRIPSVSTTGHPSGASRPAALQSDSQSGYGNVSVVDQKATQYVVKVMLDGFPMKYLIGSGSSYT